MPSASGGRDLGLRAAILTVPLTVPLTVLLALLLIVGAACGGAGSGGGAVLGLGPGGAVPTTTAPGAVPPPSTPVPLATTTTNPVPAPSTSPSTSPSASPSTAPNSPAPPAPVPVPPAGPGTYTYANAGQVVSPLGTIPLPDRASLAVAPAAGGIQRSVRTLRGDVIGLETVTELDHRADGVYLVSLRQTVALLLAVQSEELRPVAPVLVLATGDGPGTRRSVDLATSSGTARLAVEVVGEERLVVGGTSVDALVLRLDVALSGTRPGSITQTVWVDRARGLFVRERAVIAAQGATVSYELNLLSVSPA